VEATSPSPGQPRQRNWWGKNLFWVVPLGCLGLVSIIVGVAIAILFFVYGTVKSSDPYKNALAAANADTRVVQMIGSPITDRLFATGSFNTSGPTGRADFALPVKGPKGKATIFAVAVKSLGAWHFETLVVEITDTHKRIDLLDKLGTSTPAPSAKPGPD
jgi:hypothetical protein